MASARSRITQFLASNAEYAKSFPGAPKMKQMQAMMRSEGSVPISVLTCADPRCVPQAFFGPEFRGSVHQNAGGRVTEDVIRSYNVLRALANLKVVLVVHHTDCGMTHVTKDEIRDVATSKNPAAAVEVDEMDLGLFKPEDLEETVKEDVRKLRSEKTLDGLEVYGFILETDKGVVREIDV